jgi:hypothetical protein
MNYFAASYQGIKRNNFLFVVSNGVLNSFIPIHYAIPDRSGFNLHDL